METKLFKNTISNYLVNHDFEACQNFNQLQIRDHFLFPAKNCYYLADLLMITVVGFKLFFNS